MGGLAFLGSISVFSFPSLLLTPGLAWLRDLLWGPLERVHPAVLSAETTFMSTYMWYFEDELVLE